MTSLVGASLKFQVENALIKSLAEKAVSIIESKDEDKAQELRFSKLLEYNLNDDIDEYYEIFKYILPPVD